MSNLICHSKQNIAMNLDNVSSIHIDCQRPRDIKFTFPSISDGKTLVRYWGFNTEGEASGVYNKILDRFSSQID